MDAVALSACLEGALLLSERTAGGDGDPWPVQALARACVPTHRLDPPPEHTLFRVERDLVRDALVSAGLVTLAQCLPPLAAVHVIVDTTADAQRNPWETARAWWYPL
jgi:hypothetical protein